MYDTIPDTVSRAAVLRFLAQHSVPVEDFDRDHPLADRYNGPALLTWMGY